LGRKEYNSTIALVSQFRKTAQSYSRFRNNSLLFLMKINPVTKICKEACLLLENEWKRVGNDFLHG
jgi:hypothetical protein